MLAFSFKSSLSLFQLSSVAVFYLGNFPLSADNSCRKLFSKASGKWAAHDVCEKDMPVYAYQTVIIIIIVIRTSIH